MKKFIWMLCIVFLSHYAFSENFSGHDSILKIETAYMGDIYCKAIFTKNKLDAVICTHWLKGAFTIDSGKSLEEGGMKFNLQGNLLTLEDVAQRDFIFFIESDKVAKFSNQLVRVIKIKKGSVLQILGDQEKVIWTSEKL